MGKGMGQGGAWILSILVSTLLFAGILALVLSLEQKHETTELLQSNEGSDEYEIISEEPNAHDSHDKSKSHEAHDEEYEIKADDGDHSSLPKKKHLGLMKVAQGHPIGQA